MSYRIVPYCDRDIGIDSDRWTLQDYTLAEALGVPTNHQAEEIVAAALSRLDEAKCAQLGVPAGLAERVEFASEAGCFFMHSDRQADTAAVAEVIAELVAARPGTRPAPGGIEESCAYFA